VNDRRRAGWYHGTLHDHGRRGWRR
jgi:hypothetical protein